MELQVVLPFVEYFDDYHEISYYLDKLKTSLNCKKLKGEEFTFDNYSGEYWAVFFIGKRPSKKELELLVQKRGLSLKGSYWDNNYLYWNESEDD